MMGTSVGLGLEVALVLGVSGMGILALPWSAAELAESRRAFGEAARRLLGRRGSSAPEVGGPSLVPGGGERSLLPAPTRLRASGM